MEDRQHATARAKPRRNENSSDEQGDIPQRRQHNSADTKKHASARNTHGGRRNPGSRGGKDFDSNKRFNPKDKKKSSWEKEVPPARIVSDMQVTDGKHRGEYLQSSASPKIKLTARRLREILFRILHRQVRAGRFLDLCAGPGTIGIEAISRGALIGTFVERSARMCSFIRKNLKNLSIKEGHGEVFEMEVEPFLKDLSKRRRFWDIVYYDPPYNADYDVALKFFEKGAVIEPGGTLVIEHHSEMFFPEEIGVLKRWKVVVEGDTALTFYNRNA